MLKTILILEDEDLVRQSFSDFFEDNAWQVIQAKTSEQALALLDKVKVMVALVDIRLPGIDGNAFIRKALDKIQDTVFVICTGMPTYQLPQDFIESERVLSRFHTKPVQNLEHLEAELANFIQVD